MHLYIHFQNLVTQEKKPETKLQKEKFLSEVLDTALLNSFSSFFSHLVGTDSLFLFTKLTSSWTSTLFYPLLFAYWRYIIYRI